MKKYMLLHLPTGRLCGQTRPVETAKQVFIDSLYAYPYITYTEYNTFLFCNLYHKNRVEIITNEFEFIEVT